MSYHTKQFIKDIKASIDAEIYKWIGERGKDKYTPFVTKSLYAGRIIDLKEEPLPNRKLQRISLRYYRKMYILSWFHIVAYAWTEANKETRELDYVEPTWKNVRESKAKKNKSRTRKREAKVRYKKARNQYEKEM